MSNIKRDYFMVEAGALIRSWLRREIETAAWENGLEIRTDESKGLFESTYRFTVTGDSAMVSAFLVAARRWLSNVEASL